MNKIKKTKLSYIVEIPKIKDEGYLCFAEEFNHVPFEMKRFYYIFNVDIEAVRGRHAHKKTKQMLFCIQGKVTIILDNGYKREKITLTNPNHGIFLDTMMWHDMINFEKETVLLIIASEFYDEKDYIRDYDVFRSLVQKKQMTHVLSLKKMIGGIA